MRPTRSSFPVFRHLLWAAAVPALLVASPAWALYKVVGPDGRVTYSDRAPSDQPAVNIKTNGSAKPAQNLPFELAGIASRYPVVLFTGPKCAPCDSGREALQTRGIPFTEKTVESQDDIEALKRQENAGQLPVLKVGSKTLLGYTRTEWMSYLDAAGYPAASALPANYRQVPASPLVTRATNGTTSAAPASAPTVPPAAPAAEGGREPGNAPPGFQF